MSRRPVPLPETLPWRVFTRAEALGAGISLGRLRASDLVGLRPGLFARRGERIEEGDVLAALCRHDPSVVGVGLTAARLRDFPLPREHQSWTIDTPLHIASQTGRWRSGGALIAHRLALPHEHVESTEYRQGGSTLRSPLRVTTPARTWHDLGAELAEWRLVSIGDHLIRHPRPGLEGRWEPWCEPRELKDLCTGPHAPVLRRATQRIRVGSDSPMETLLRLAFEGAGLPAPLLNVPLRDAQGRGHHAPDFQWPRFGLCAEYDGRTHAAPTQVSRDIARSLSAERAGFRELRFGAEDAAGGGRRAVARLRQALHEQGWRD